MRRLAATTAVAAAALLGLPGNSSNASSHMSAAQVPYPASESARTAKTLSAQARARPEPQRERGHRFGQTPTGHVVPVQRFRISSYFRNTDPVHVGGMHSGVDFAAAEGRKIVSICPGKVVDAGWLGAAGNAVIVRTEDGHRVLYGHMSVVLVGRGDRVTAGEALGRIGSTGNSTGPHLHLQVNTPKGRLTDPVEFMGLGHREIVDHGRRKR